VRLIWILGVLAVIEGYSRLLGWWDYRIYKRTHVVWDIAWTTKEVKQPVEAKEKWKELKERKEIREIKEIS
jgi:hypothetical protein